MFFAISTAYGDFNPRPPRGGRRLLSDDVVNTRSISIHAPREGGDAGFPVRPRPTSNISIHAPREGGDRGGFFMSNIDKQFQSTPPARGATVPITRLIAGTQKFQSTPPARGATNYTSLFIVCRVFQSTPPARGATDLLSDLRKIEAISIHAPREGGDLLTAPVVVIVAFISIHAPREGGDLV